MNLLPPRSTRTDTLVPSTTLFRSFPGFIDPVNGTILQSPNLPGLQGKDLASGLAARIDQPVVVENDAVAAAYGEYRSEEHTSELQSLMRSSYAVFCLKKK